MTNRPVIRGFSFLIRASRKLPPPDLHPISTGSVPVRAQRCTFQPDQLARHMVFSGDPKVRKLELQRGLIDALVGSDAQPGDTLPGKKYLAQATGLCAETIMAGYRWLRDQGIINMPHGRFCVVQIAAKDISATGVPITLDEFNAVIQFDPAHPLPVVAQLTQKIELAIRNGMFQTGRLLPSESGLARRLSIGRSSARKIFQRLSENGSVRKEGESFVIVKKPKLRAPTILTPKDIGDLFTSSSEQKYHQDILRVLHQAISDDRLIPGDRFPSLIKLADYFEVTIWQVRLAFWKLEEWRYIERKMNRLFVAPKRPSPF